MAKLLWNTSCIQLYTPVSVKCDPVIIDSNLFLVLIIHGLSMFQTKMYEYINILWDFCATD